MTAPAPKPIIEPHVVTSCIGPKVIDHDPDDIETNSPPLRMAKAWKKEPLYQRLDMCCLALSIHGCITHAERERIRDKIQKHLSNGRYHEMTEDAP